MGYRRNRWSLYTFRYLATLTFDSMNLTFDGRGEILLALTFCKTNSGIINTWDYQWFHTIWRNKGVCLIPRNNLVVNIGFEVMPPIPSPVINALIHYGQANLNSIFSHRTRKQMQPSITAFDTFLKRTIRAAYIPSETKKLDMKAMLKKSEKWTRPSFLKVVAEINRIRSIPGFNRSSTMIRKKLLFTDSDSFIQSYHEIFGTTGFICSMLTILPAYHRLRIEYWFVHPLFKRCFPAAGLLDLNLIRSRFIRTAPGQPESVGPTDVEVHQKAVLDVHSRSSSSQGGSSGHLDDNREGANQVKHSGGSW